MLVPAFASNGISRDEVESEFWKWYIEQTVTVYTLMGGKNGENYLILRWTMIFYFSSTRIPISEAKIRGFLFRLHA